MDPFTETAIDEVRIGQAEGAGVYFVNAMKSAGRFSGSRST